MGCPGVVGSHFLRVCKKGTGQGQVGGVHPDRRSLGRLAFLSVPSAITAGSGCVGSSCHSHTHVSWLVSELHQALAAVCHCRAREEQASQCVL